MTADDFRAVARAELDAGGPMMARRRHPAGKGIPESPEVRQHREDAEAVRMANFGTLDRLDRGERPPDESSLAAALFGLVVFVVCVAAMWGACTAAASWGWL